MRLEYKYLLNTELLESFKECIKPFVKLDKYAEVREAKEYIVRSIYLDTLNFNFYHEKVEGLRTRKKLRIRGYNFLNENETVFLEIKRKYENRILKNRSPLLFEDLNAFINNRDIDKLKTSEVERINDARRFLYNLVTKNLVPTSLVVYDREAYYSLQDNYLRITLDKNLRCKSFPNYEDLFSNNLAPAMPKQFIIEVKFFNGIPLWLTKIIKEFQIKRLPVSKYTICVDDDLFHKVSKRKSALALIN